MKKTFRSLLLLLLLAIGLGMGGCRPAPAASDRPVLLVSIAPLQYLLDSLAGGRMEVQALVPRGASPETFEPSPAQVFLFGKAAGYAGIGLIGFERVWAGRIAREYPGLPFCNLSEGLPLVGDSLRPDPHVWMSPRNMASMASRACRFLCGVDPEGAGFYRGRRDRLLRRLALLSDSVRSLLPAQPVAFVSYHPTLTYFAREYGLTQIPIEADGKEPSARRLRELAATVRESRARVIFVQPEFGKRPAQNLSEATGLPIETVDPLSPDWERELLRLASLLGKYASAR